MDSNGSTINFHLRARGKQLEISNAIAIHTLKVLTLERLDLKDSKSCPENAKYNPIVLTINAMSSFKFLFN